MGYYEAGFTEIIGVDTEYQENYPFEFIQMDAFDANLQGYDLVHASPPCQRWSSASGVSMAERRKRYPDLLRPMRELLKAAQVNYVIENVEGSPLENPTKLCGTFFPEIQVLRHRLFESNLNIPQPNLDCGNHPKIWGWGELVEYEVELEAKPYVTVAGGGQVPLEFAKQAMGIDWMNQDEISQSIPPVYTKFIGMFARIQIEGHKSALAKQI